MDTLLSKIFHDLISLGIVVGVIICVIVLVVVIYKSRKK